MATSTFGKTFSVSKKSASGFVKEMGKKVEPTLPSSFKSNFTTLENNSNLKSQLLNALRK